MNTLPTTMNLLRFDFEANRRVIKTIKNPHPVSVPTKKKKEHTTPVSASFKYEGRMSGILQAPISANTAIKLNRMCEIKKDALRGSGSGYLTIAYTTQTSADKPTEVKNTLQMIDSSFFVSGERFCRNSGARTKGSSVLISFHNRLFSPPRKTPKRIKNQAARKLRYIGFFKTGRKMNFFFSIAEATETSNRQNIAKDIPKFHKGSINAQSPIAMS